MWWPQIWARLALAAVLAAAATAVIVARGDAARALGVMYDALLVSAVALLGVLVTAMSILVGLQHLRQGRASDAFRRTVRSFRVTVNYTACLSFGALLGTTIRLTPHGWVIPAVFTVTFSFASMLVLIAGLVRAVGDAMEV